MSRSKDFAIPALLLLLTAAIGPVCAHTRPPVLPALPADPPGTTVSYLEDVKPVLEGRCVVCHGCYDAPCQLLLSSHAGLERGASKAAVYHSDRLIPTDPTRLFIDAKTTEQWRQRGFFSVLHDHGLPRADALMLRMLALGRSKEFPPNQKLPSDLPLDITRKLSCPTAAEFDGYAANHPLGGMPYGMAPLEDQEIRTLVSWVLDGAPPPPPPPALPATARTQVDRWEDFLNGDSLRERIVARYLYEHWFLAHLYFANLAEGPFFRIVRSKSPPGSAVDEIATRRPYDDPGTTQFWYRLAPIQSTIVHKTHIVYPLSDARMQRLSELFLEPSWRPTRLPGYGVEEASNPFVSFEEIPARSRYRFLLDDAQYFLMTFIRGPVCRGQVAVDVIEDHFFVVFLDPDHDVSVTNPSFLESTKDLLRLPAEHELDVELLPLWLLNQRAQGRYLDVREEFYAAEDPEALGPRLDFVWNGDGTDPNALLTVFRHFDNATVAQGFVGEIPKTAWVMDFPIFERIYYDLVANFDVFGNVAHQLATRLYMDNLRMQSENLFVAFLPADRRKEVRASWYVDAKRPLTAHTNRLRGLERGTQIRFTSPNVVAELLELILTSNPQIAGPPDLLNRCKAAPCSRPGASPLEERAERALRTLTGVRGAWVAELPDLAFLRVRDDTRRDARIYSLIHNEAHTNVASLFDEQERREPEKDTLTVVRGYLGSYPNFLFDVEISEIEAYTAAILAVEDAAGLDPVVERWGVRRTSPAFWESVDWLHADFRRQQPTEAGLFDLARYKNL